MSDVAKRINVNDLISQLQSLIQTPVAALERLKSESASVRDLFEKYVLPLVVIPALCSFIGFALLGPVGLGAGIKALLLRVVFGLAGFYLLMLLVQALAPHFGGTNSQVDILKWAIAGSFITAAASTLDLLRFLPFVGFIITAVQLVAVVYSIYILWLGQPILLGITGSRRIVFFLSLFGAALLIGLVLSFLGLSMV